MPSCDSDWLLHQTRNKPCFFFFYQIRQLNAPSNWDWLTTVFSLFLLPSAYVKSCLGWQMVTFSGAYDCPLARQELKWGAGGRPRGQHRCGCALKTEVVAKFLCFEIFAWDWLASLIYAATATMCLMKITQNAKNWLCNAFLCNDNEMYLEMTSLKWLQPEIRGKIKHDDMTLWHGIPFCITGHLWRKLPEDFPHKGPVIQSFDVSLMLAWTSCLNWEMSSWRFEKPLHSCDITVIAVYHIHLAVILLTSLGCLWAAHRKIHWSVAVIWVQVSGLHSPCSRTASPLSSIQNCLQHKQHLP